MTCWPQMVVLRGRIHKVDIILIVFFNINRQQKKTKINKGRMGEVKAEKHRCFLDIK